MTPRALRTLAALLLLTLAAPATARDAAVTFRGIVIPDRSGVAMTVDGPLAPERLGAVMPHEHLLIDLTKSYPPPRARDAADAASPAFADRERLWAAPFTARLRGRLLANMFGSNRDALILDDEANALAELRELKAAGGGTLVDVTTYAMGRNPVKLQRLSRESGVAIVMGAGLYRRAYHPPDIDRLSVDDLTERMVREVVEGVDGTGIRAGIIGEIGAEDVTTAPLDSNEVRVLRAAARASRLTGAAITLHNLIGRNIVWHSALEILEAEGADLSRVVMGHVTADSAADFGFLESLLARGVYLEFDTLGAPFAVGIPEIDNRPNVVAIRELVRRGHADRILLSQDVCTKYQLSQFGGQGYGFVLTNLVPWLRANGVTQRDIDLMTKINPARVLTFARPRPLPAAR